MAALVWLRAQVCAADNPTPITLDTNETLFVVLAAMNTCGYDVDLNRSDAQRLNIRAEVQTESAGLGRGAGRADHDVRLVPGARGRDPAHDLSQYVSLALYLQGPPHFIRG